MNYLSYYTLVTLTILIVLSSSANSVKITSCDNFEVDGFKYSLKELKSYEILTGSNSYANYTFTICQNAIGGCGDCNSHAGCAIEKNSKTCIGVYKPDSFQVVRIKVDGKDALRLYYTKGQEAICSNDYSFDDITDEPTDDTVDLTDSPIDDTNDEPTDDTVDLTDSPIDDTTDEPTDEATDEPTDDTVDLTDSPIDDTTDEPTDDTVDLTDSPIDDTTDESTDEPTDEPTDDKVDLTDSPIDDTTDEPTDDTVDLTDSPIDDTTDEPTDEPTDDTVDLTDSPIDDTTDEPTDDKVDLTDSPIDDTTDDNDNPQEPPQEPPQDPPQIEPVEPGFHRLVIEIICEEVSSGKPTYFDIKSPKCPQTTHVITFSHRSACPIGKKKLSAGSVMLIIIFVTLSVYLIGGLLINIFAREKKGVEAIPNYSFWSELPSLIKDGFNFVISKITGKKRYSAINEPNEYTPIRKGDILYE